MAGGSQGNAVFPVVVTGLVLLCAVPMTLDGIVYAGMVGVGFAFTESILYLARAYDGSHGIGPYAHPLFTACTGVGVGVGIVVNSRRRLTRILAPVAGYGCAVLAHAVWNTSTVFGPGSFVMAYLILTAPVILTALALAVWVRRSERRMLTGALADAAQRGLIELGFLHSRYLRGVPPPDFAARGHDYVERISALRPSIGFPGQVVPVR
jgi:peptidoglycan/LPS O-acetylase OafA/YrhL